MTAIFWNFQTAIWFDDAHEEGTRIGTKFIADKVQEFDYLAWWKQGKIVVLAQLAVVATSTTPLINTKSYLSGLGKV